MKKTGQARPRTSTMVLRLRSTGFAGQYPPGIHWTPGEERTLPEGHPATGPLPAGLEAVEAPQEGAGGGS